jgi:hypothetical protein
MSTFRVDTVVTTIDSRGKKTKKPYSHSSTSLTDIQWENISISAGAVKFVWNPNVWLDYEPSAFSVLGMVADGDLDIEIGIQTTDSAKEFNSFRLAADTFLTFATNAAYYNHASTTDAAFGGTLGVMDSIRVAEPSTASVSLSMLIGR